LAKRQEIDLIIFVCLWFKGKIDFLLHSHFCFFGLLRDLRKQRIQTVTIEALAFSDRRKKSSTVLGPSFCALLLILGIKEHSSSLKTKDLGVPFPLRNQIARLKNLQYLLVESEPSPLKSVETSVTAEPALKSSLTPLSRAFLFFRIFLVPGASYDTSKRESRAFAKKKITFKGEYLGSFSALIFELMFWRWFCCLHTGSIRKAPLM